jgi:hypothetical protein
MNACKLRSARRFTLGALVAMLALGLLGASPAPAAFTRSQVGEISTSGSLGLAIDGADNLWVGGVTGQTEQSREDQFDEYSPLASGNVLLQTFSNKAYTFPESMAIENTTGHLYLTGENRSNNNPKRVEVFDGAGSLLETWKDEFRSNADVAVDSSTEQLSDPSACGTPPLALGECYVYVAHDATNPGAPSGDGLAEGIEKFNTKGEAVPFSASGSVPYVKNNGITGTESGGFPSEALGAIAIDGEGNIYAIVAGSFVAGTRQVVVEYSAGGRFVRAFDGAGTPGLGESHEQDGWGGALDSLAFDPVSHHILVAVDHFREVATNENGVEITHEEPVDGSVDEFDARSGRYLNQITEASPGVRLHSALDLAVDSHGDLYVNDTDLPSQISPQQHAIEVYGPGHFAPGLRLAEASERTSTGAVLNGSVNVEADTDPERLGLSDCHFDYVSETAFAQSGFAAASSAPCAPAAGSLPKDSSYHAVHAALGGLAAGTTYRYRLVATTEGALGAESVSGVLAFTTPHAPAIESTSATNLSSTFAELRAQIDPLGADTGYHFEYDTRAFAGAEAHGLSVPVPDGDIGAGGAGGSAVESVSQQVAGLVAGSTYHFRVVASNVAGSTYGPDETFTTLPAPAVGLPDGRSYELVTPVDKTGGSDMFAAPFENDEYSNLDDGTPSDTGNGFVLETHAGFGPFPGNEDSAYVLARTGGAWGYTSLASPALGVQSILNVTFDPSDLSRVGVRDYVGSKASEAGQQSTGLLGPPGGPYSTLYTSPALHGQAGDGGQTTQIVGADRGLDSVLIEGPNPLLCPGAEELKHGEALCELSGGEAKLVNADSEGALIGRCGAALGSDGAGGGGKAHNAVSPDGSQVIFTAPDPSSRAQNSGPGCWNGAAANTPQLYLRSHEHTIELSEPEAGVSDPTGRHLAEYVGASKDGSRVFFLSEGWLTADHPVIHDLELYECEITEEAGEPACRLTRISAGEPGSRAGSEGAAVQGVLALADDAGAVYFTARAALAEGAPALAAGQELVNLYRYDTASSTTAYVATINRSDSDQTSYGACAQVGFANGDSRAPCPRASWYSTPDGRYLLFASSRDLTGYDNSGQCVLSTDGAPTGACEELYRYDASTRALICVSCDPSGAQPVSNALFSRSSLVGPDSGQQRGMSDDGSYVFFDTADALVPQDINGTLDVYEWHEGRIALLSSGRDAGPSFFLGASSDGSNAFIGTHAQLVPQDIDTLGDIYDARICTAADPCVQPPPGATAQCEGDACQNPSAAPIDATPSSLTFAGPGNAAAPTSTPLKPRELTRAQQLSRALAVCKREAKRSRAACERRARQRYGPKAKSKSKVKKSKPAKKGGK